MFKKSNYLALLDYQYDTMIYNMVIQHTQIKTLFLLMLSLLEKMFLTLVL